MLKVKIIYDIQRVLLSERDRLFHKYMASHFRNSKHCLKMLRTYEADEKAHTLSCLPPPKSLLHLSESIRSFIYSVYVVTGLKL